MSGSSHPLRPRMRRPSLGQWRMIPMPTLVQPRGLLGCLPGSQPDPSSGYRSTWRGAAGRRPPSRSGRRVVGRPPARIHSCSGCDSPSSHMPSEHGKTDTPRLEWASKPHTVERVALPFQAVETINESRATRQAQAGSLFGSVDSPTHVGWRNKLIWGDNKLVAASLQSEYSGAFDLIYIDPPFATGADFRVSVRIGSGDLDKEPSILEETAYRDTWGRGLSSYLTMVYERIALMRDLLSDRGTFYVHCDHRVVAPLKMICDEIFGSQYFRNIVTWRRQIPRGMKVHARFMPFSSDYLLMYTKGDDALWYSPKKETLLSLTQATKKYMRDERGFFRTSDPGTYSNASLIRLNEEGRIYVSKGGEVVIEDGKLSVTKGTIGVKYYREQRGDQVVEETVIDNIWDDVPGMGVVSSEYVGYPTQKPERYRPGSSKCRLKPGAWLVDFFCGSGTTAWSQPNARTAMDWLRPRAIRDPYHSEAPLGIHGCSPFEIANPGPLRATAWQDATTGGEIDAYLGFILALYDAQPMDGYQHICMGRRLTDLSTSARWMRPSRLMRSSK